MKADIWDKEQRIVIEQLKNHKIPPTEIGSAIVRLAKPYREERIAATKDIVAAYLRDENPWARHEAMWFLTSWARLREYEPQLGRDAQFAQNFGSQVALCLGIDISCARRLSLQPDG